MRSVLLWGMHCLKLRNPALFFINIYASSSVLGTFEYTDSILIATSGRRHFSPVFKDEETASEGNLPQVMQVF